VQTLTGVEQGEVAVARTQAGLALRRAPVFVCAARMKNAGINLYLVGFTGTGKSTVGRHVARHLGMEFLDSDHEIERVHGKTIAQIFAEDGEPAFRALERTFVESGHPGQGCIVACGGGLVVPDGMLKLLQARGVVICLHASLETVLQRTIRSVHRPLLDGDDREKRVRELYAPREEIYRRTGTMILTDRRPMREVVAHVLRVYARESQEWTPPSP
jgi:shikimate kinase